MNVVRNDTRLSQVSKVYGRVPTLPFRILRHIHTIHDPSSTSLHLIGQCVLLDSNHLTHYCILLTMRYAYTSLGQEDLSALIGTAHPTSDGLQSSTEQDEPPSYTSENDEGQSLPYHETAESILQIISSSSRDEVDWPKRPSTYEIQRLQNFLIYCLATDYQIHTIPTLKPDDWTHFLRLSQYISDIIRHDEWMYTGGPADTLAAFFAASIFEPARALGLPPCSVIVMIHRFSRSLDSFGRYEGTLHRILNDRGPHCLAGKLLLDREIMINALVPSTNPGMRKVLFDGLEELQSIHFISLTGPDSYTMTKEGADFEAYRVSGAIGMKLLRALSPSACHKKIKEYVALIKRRVREEEQQQDNSTTPRSQTEESVSNALPKEES